MTLKEQNRIAGYEELDILAALDFQVQEFSPFHYRINGRLDIWPSTKKFFDKATSKTGSYDSLVEIAQDICAASS